MICLEAWNPTAQWHIIRESLVPSVHQPHKPRLDGPIACTSSKPSVLESSPSSCIARTFQSDYYQFDFSSLRLPPLERKKLKSRNYGWILTKRLETSSIQRAVPFSCDRMYKDWIECILFRRVPRKETICGRDDIRVDDS